MKMSWAKLLASQMVQNYTTLKQEIGELHEVINRNITNYHFSLTQKEIYLM
jgi:hypothetical protein